MVQAAWTGMSGINREHVMPISQLLLSCSFDGVFANL